MKIKVVNVCTREPKTCISSFGDEICGQTDEHDSAIWAYIHSVQRTHINVN
jgi:hypothetical protein